MTTFRPRGYVQFRKDGYWYPIRVIETVGEEVLIAVKRHHRGRPRQYWVRADRLRASRPAALS